VLVSDTVGFIKHLPHDLVASFRSTLDEARECDLLVHLVDASDPACEAQIAVTREVLASIGATAGERWMVMNKADRLDAETRERILAGWPEARLLSAKRPEDVASFREDLVAFFERDMEEAELIVPYALQRLVAKAHESGHVLDEAHDAEGTRLRLRATPEVLEQLREALRAAAPV
jgi:GTP-binding protein HflX